MTVKHPTAAEVREALLDWVPASRITFEDGWNTRGRPWSYGIRGVMAHHTAGLMPGTLAWMLQRGTSAYPYCNLLITRDNRTGSGDGKARAYVLSALSAWHSGTGRWPNRNAGIPDNAGHLAVFGVEIESRGAVDSAGRPIDDITDNQWKRFGQVAAAIRQVAGRDAFPGFSRVIRHRDWAPGRKPDVFRDLDDVRGFAKDAWKRRNG